MNALQDLLLQIRLVQRPHGEALVEVRLDAGQRVAARNVFLLARLGGTRRLVERPFDRFQIGQREFGVDRFDVVDRVDRARHMRHVVVLEAADDVRDRVGLADVRQELVAEALALRGAGHQPGDIDELHGRRNDFLRLGDVRQRLQARIGHLDHADVRLDRAERIVLGRDLRRRERIEQCRFANVRQADDAAGNSHLSCRQSWVCSFFIAALILPSTSSGSTPIVSSMFRSMADSMSTVPGFST